MSLLLFTLSSAHAFGTVELTAGEPEFAGCLDDAGCLEAFSQFLGGAMAEQGFTFQHDPVATSATIHRAHGVVAGVQIDTFPLGVPPTNLSGKAENTQFSPVLPRLIAGVRGGGPLEWGAGAFFLPGIPVQGASAWLAGADLSAATDAGRFRLGAEGEITWVRATAPIVATEDQFASRDEWNNPDNLDPDTYEAVCGAIEGGCVDTFTSLSPSLRLVASTELGGGFTPYAKVGATLVDQELYVMYDDTTWTLRTVQPNVAAGSTYALGTRTLLSAGGSAAYLLDDAAIAWKLQASASVLF